MDLFKYSTCPFAINNTHEKYESTDYMIRAKLYKGLCNGNMKMQSIYDDEKYKLSHKRCSYCGEEAQLSLDHLVPRYAGGVDCSDNLVYACKKCNSSKNKLDLIVWCAKNDKYPPILVLRRYVKLAYIYFETQGILDEPFNELNKHTTIFRIDLLPYEFPQPMQLIL